MAGAAEEDGFEFFAELREVFEAGDFSGFGGDAILVDEAVGGAEAAGIDEFDDAVEVIEAVFERCAGEDEGEAGLEAFDDAAGFGFPVFDALGFIEDDEVPVAALDFEVVAEDLFVVADGEKFWAVVLGSALGDGAADELYAAVTEFGDFIAPLGFEGGWADDEDAADASVAGEELGDADALDGFAEAHFIGENGAAFSGGEGDAVHLIGQELGVQEGVT